MSLRLVHWTGEVFADSFECALALQTEDRRLLALYRMRPHDIEEELRPVFSSGELKLHQYREVRTLRAQRSTHHQDLLHWQVRYPDDGAMNRSYGVAWGDDFSRLLRSPFLRDYILEDPASFFEGTKSGWWAPQWAASFADARYTTKTSWTLDRGRVLYLFRRKDNQVLRLIETDANGKLQRFFEYLAEHQLIIRAEEPLVKTTESPPRSCGLASWDLMPDELAQELGPEISSDAPGNARELPLTDPGAFFEGPGRSLVVWRKSFSAAKNDLGRWDRSWAGSDGERYQILAWQQGPSEIPEWCLLRYEDDHLVEVRHYDRFWLPTIYRPSGPIERAARQQEATAKPAEEGPTARFEFRPLHLTVAGQALAIPGPVIAIVGFGVVLLLTVVLVRRVRRRRREDEDLRAFRARLDSDS